MDEFSTEADLAIPPNGSPMWVQDESDPQLVRYWDGYKWKSASSTVEFATLQTLHLIRQESGAIKAQLEKIRFRVGFLSLVVLISIILGVIAIILGVLFLASVASEFSSLEWLNTIILKSLLISNYIRV